MLRPSVRSILAVAIVSAGSMVTPIAASAATGMLVRGTATCSSDEPAVGVWIESSAGGSEWADDQSWQFSSSKKSYRYFEETIASPSSKTTIALHVGCGGEPKDWDKDLWSDGFSVGSGGKVINVLCDYGKRERRAGACVPPPEGTKASENPYPGKYKGGTSGYCTGGAVYQWHRATGYWPAINRGAPGLDVGHAKYMDDHARANGFRVVKVPHVRSLVVFNEQGALGHVGWVTRIYRKNGRVLFDFEDRNGASDPGNGITKDFGKDVARYEKAWDKKTQHFIIAPVK